MQKRTQKGLRRVAPPLSSSQSLSCLPVRSGSCSPAPPRCMVGTSDPACPICLPVFPGLLPHSGHHFRALMYSPGPRRGHSFKGLSVEAFPLRTPRERKMPGEDEKERKGSDFRTPREQDRCRREQGPACSEADLSRGVSASHPPSRPLPVPAGV